MSRRAVACWKHLTRNDESGGIGTEVLEEIGETVEEYKNSKFGLLNKRIVAKAHAAEDNGERNETHDLNRLAAPRVDQKKSSPVTRNETDYGEDKVTNTNAVKRIVNFWCGRSCVIVGRITDGLEYGGRVKAKAIEGNLLFKCKQQFRCCYLALRLASRANQDQAQPKRTLKFDHFE